MLFSRGEKGENPFDEELYLRSYKKMFIAVNLMVRDPELAKDAVQEGIYRALKNYDTLRNKKKFCSWATRIAMNYAKDMMVKNSRQMPTNEIDSRIEANSGKEGDSDPVGDFVLLKYDVEKVLAELNDDEREILILKYFLDYATEDIALLLDLTTNNVNLRLRRAREKYQKVAVGLESSDRGGEDYEK